MITYPPSPAERALMERAATATYKAKLQYLGDVPLGQAEKDKESRPIRQRLAMVDDLLADNRGQVGRRLDLYLSEDLAREVLTDRKTRLETTIRCVCTGPGNV